MSELADAEGANPGFADYVPELAAAGPRRLIRVRTATDLDFNDILAVQTESARPAMERRLLDGILHDPHRQLLVALDDGTVVGWAKTHYWASADGTAGAGHYLGGVTVVPSHRRKGIADALTARRLDWIRMRAADVWYIVNASNLASIDLHKRWGFEEVARGSSFHGTAFTGGTGILFHAALEADPTQPGSSR